MTRSSARLQTAEYTIGPFAVAAAWGIIIGATGAPIWLALTFPFLWLIGGLR